VVVSLPLPRVSGTLVYEDLRSRKTTRSTPVIILSRDQLPQFPDEYVTVLRKPLETTVLVAAVAAALGKTPSPPVA
jgi:DNA-binding response OmpR family regulator